MARRTQRAATLLLAAFVLGGVAVGTWRAVGRARPATAGVGAGAPIVRGARVVARVERVTRPRGRGRLPLFLAYARDPALDSTRVGLLVPVWRADTLRLVRRDEVPGLGAVGRLVTAGGDPGVVVLGDAP